MEENPQTSVILATRLGARILHDLAGATQGVKAALALMSEAHDPDGRAEACAYAMASAADLEARLSFCRAAYGGAPPAGRHDLEALSQTPFAGRRGRLRWAAHDEGAPASLGSAMLIFAQISSLALAAGGEAVASLVRAPGSRWLGRLDASGPRLRMDPQALSALAGAGPLAGAVSGRWADGALARALILEGGGEIAVHDGGAVVALEARMPAAR
jgi:hypothetical protein